MASDKVNKSRRRLLAAATSAVGAVGAVGAAVPFVGSWSPSAKARAAGAPVKADISKLEPGRMMMVEWRGKPIYVLRRTPEQVQGLSSLDGDLKDPGSEGSVQPDYVDRQNRAIRPEIMVFVGLCTHLGCTPKFRPDVGADDMGGDEWLGGFFCPCHGSRFDLAGRVYSDAPASENLEVPPHSFEGESGDILVVGVDEEVA